MVELIEVLKSLIEAERQFYLDYAEYLKGVLEGLENGLVQEVDEKALEKVVFYKFVKGKREEALPGDPGWTFSRDSDGNLLESVKDLYTALMKSKEQKIVVGKYEYRLSGRNLSLIQRRPIK
ncbi:hypothetical protein J7L60_06070 [Candidatus Bathyarchaeota archaeon]|nr:hypothetical protein [Candidatus Bathyarchaeota archaeon]